MRDFFIPTKNNIIESEDFLKKSVIPFLKDFGYSLENFKRVFAIEIFKPTYKTYHVDGVSPFTDETIFVILELLTKILVCTTCHGVIRGKPYEINKVDCNVVEYFNESDKNCYKQNDWIYQMNGANHEVLHPKKRPVSLFKYYPNNNYSKDALLKSYLFCSHPYHLNDSMDCSSSLWNFEKITIKLYDMYFKHNPKYSSLHIPFEEAQLEDFKSLKMLFWEDMTDKCGVVSLSETKFNILMWSHYSSERGFMIELDTEIFLNELKSLNQNLRNYVFMPINYNKELQQIDFFNKCFTSADIPFLYSLDVKKQEWSYENEWRLVSYSDGYGVPSRLIDTREDREGVVPRHINYSSNCIKSITLGKEFFNGNNLKSLKKDTIELSDDEELGLFILDNYPNKLFISEEINSGYVLKRERVKVDIVKIGQRKYVMKKIGNIG